MPELPEVETIRRGLEAHIAGATITKVELRRADLRQPFPPEFAKALEGRTIRHIERRAKYLLFTLDNRQVLIAHLGMSGAFTVWPKGGKAEGKHDHVVFHLAGGDVLVFSDPRRFGLMTLTSQNALDQHPLLAHLGPDPLSKAFSPSYLKEQLTRRKGPIKPALMDQQLVVGVGNIYASEALFRAHILPDVPAHTVSNHAAPLVKAIRAVLNDAIESGGSSLRDFMQVRGEAGYFQHKFQVYGRAGKPCYICGTAIKSAKQAGRTTFWCPSCQNG